MKIKYNQIYLDAIEYHNNLNPIHLIFVDIKNNLLGDLEPLTQFIIVFIFLNLLFRITRCKVSIIYFNILFSLTCFAFTTGISNLTYFNNEYGYKCYALSTLTLAQYNDKKIENDNTIGNGFLIISGLLSLLLFKYAKFIGSELKSGSILKRVTTLYLLLSGEPIYNSILMLNPTNILSFIFQIERIIAKFFINQKIGNLGDIISAGQSNSLNMQYVLVFFQELYNIISNLCFKNYTTSPRETLSYLDTAWFLFNSQCFDLYSFITLSYKFIIIIIIIKQLIKFESTTCKHILQRGERHGQTCNKNVITNGFCAIHQKDVHIAI
jgi:hypothetical protein